MWFTTFSSSRRFPWLPTQTSSGLINDVASTDASCDADVNVNSLSFDRLIDAMVTICDDVGDWCSRLFSIELSTCVHPCLWKSIVGLEWEKKKKQKFMFCFQCQLAFINKSTILTWLNGNFGNFEYHLKRNRFQKFVSKRTENWKNFPSAHVPQKGESDCSNCSSISFTTRAVNWYCYLWAHTFPTIGKKYSSLKFEACFEAKHKGKCREKHHL